MRLGVAMKRPLIGPCAMRWLYVLMLWLAPCGCSEALSDTPTRPNFFEVYSEDAELQAQLEKWAPRWTKASGITIVASDKGIPVFFREDIEVPPDPDVAPELQNTVACGVTVLGYHKEDPDGWYNVKRIEIDHTPPAGCPGWGYSVGHELGHVLAGPVAEHGRDGVFNRYLEIGGLLKITAGSLEAVCRASHCSAFNPEE